MIGFLNCLDVALQEQRPVARRCAQPEKQTIGIDTDSRL